MKSERDISLFGSGQLRNVERKWYMPGRKWTTVTEWNELPALLYVQQFWLMIEGDSHSHEATTEVLHWYSGFWIDICLTLLLAQSARSNCMATTGTPHTYCWLMDDNNNSNLLCQLTSGCWMLEIGCRMCETSQENCGSLVRRDAKATRHKSIKWINNNKPSWTHC